MPDVVRLIASAALAIAVLASTVACKDLEPAQRPHTAGLADLVAFHRGAETIRACLGSPELRAGVLVEDYRALTWDDRDVEQLLAAWRPNTDRSQVHVKVLYANDPDVPASLRRSRPAVFVGTQPYVAAVDGAWLPAVFVFHRDRWVCLVDIDGKLAARIDDGPCRATYLGIDTGRCFDFTAPLATAVLTGDRVNRERLCALMVAHGCGSVPAEAPPPTEPVPTP